MLRSDVEKRLNMTRKALEYYEEKGLIHPERGENGYRDYSEADLERLSKIVTLRDLGLRIHDIETLLNDNDQRASIYRKYQFSIERDQKKNEILQRLIAGEGLSDIQADLSMIEKQETVYQRLERIFPGYFGQAIFSAYQPFLNHTIAPDKEKYFDAYISYLDSLPAINFTDAEKQYLEEQTASFDLESLDEVHENKIAAVNDPEKYLKDHQEAMEMYLLYLQSDEFSKSPMKSIKEKTTQYMLDNRYYEIAIPLIRKFSEPYDDYYKKLLQANEVFESSFYSGRKEASKDES